MINGLMSVVVIFLIFSVGFWFTSRKLWPDNTTSVLSVVVVKIAAPALAITSIASHFDQELLRAALFHLLILLIYTLILHLIGKALAKITRLKDGKKTVFEVTFTFSNTIFIGLPINVIVFGQEGLPYLFTFYLITLAVFWSLGAYQLANASSLYAKGFSPKKILSPGLIGVVIGALVVQFNVSIPLVFNSVLGYLGALTVPLSLLVIGSNLVFFTRGIPKITVDEVLILVGKFVISPLVMFVLLRLFQVEGLAFQVFMLTATMPCHMQTSILAEYYEVESEYASKLVSLSTLVCLVTIPLYAALLG